MRRKREVHSAGPFADFTLCGVAHDVADVDPSEKAPRIARRLRDVDCVSCLMVIEFVRKLAPDVSARALARLKPKAPNPSQVKQ